MDQAATLPNSDKEDICNKLSQKTEAKRIKDKLQKDAKRILGSNNVSLSEGREILLNKVIDIVTQRVANNCLSPKGKENLPKLLKEFLKYWIKASKDTSEDREIEPDKELDRLIDDLIAEVNLEFIQKIGHNIADIFVIKRNRIRIRKKN